MYSVDPSVKPLSSSKELYFLKVMHRFKKHYKKFLKTYIKIVKIAKVLRKRVKCLTINQRTDTDSIARYYQLCFSLIASIQQLKLQKLDR
jgi:hypothetical protein